MNTKECKTDLHNRRMASYVWLAYVLFLFIDPFFNPSVKLWTITLTAFAVFVGLFVLYVQTENYRLRCGIIAAIFALGLVVFPRNGGASTFFVYVAGFLPFMLPPVGAVLSVFVLEIAAMCAETFLLHMHWPNTIIGAGLVLVIGGSNIFFAQQKRADEKLRAAQEENLALAAVAERERIARDLHDVLGHTLSVIVLKAELAGRLLRAEAAGDSAANRERAAREIGEVERTARTALAEVREAIGGYRARGLQHEIEAARRTLDAAGVTLRCDKLPETAAKLRANEETVLSLALREAVTNIVRHAHATECTLRFQVEGGQHRLVVEDNGRHTATREGNGIRGMRERVEALGGRLSVDRSQGTRLQIALPVHSEAR